MRNGWLWGAMLLGTVACGSDDGSDSPGDAGEQGGDGSPADGTTGDGSAGDGSAGDGSAGDGSTGGDGSEGLDGGAGDAGQEPVGDGGYDPGPGGAIDLMYTQSEDCNAVIQPTGPLVGGVTSSGDYSLVTVGTGDASWLYSLVTNSAPMTGRFSPIANEVAISFQQKIGEDMAVWKAVSGTLSIDVVGDTFAGGTVMSFEDLVFEVEEAPAAGTFTANGSLTAGAR